jgi:hypothetical protein
MPYKKSHRKKMRHRDYEVRKTKLLKSMRKKYATDPAYRLSVKARVNRHRLKYLEVVEPIILEFKKGGCLLCGESEPCCLVAHHVDPSEKEYEIGFMRKCLMKVDKIVAELKKCVCVCHNCHSKVHAGLVTLPRKY